MAQSDKTGAGQFVEIRSYNLKPGTRARFHQVFLREALPMLHRWKVEVVGYGPSLHDADSFFLMRAFPGVEERQRSEDAFYGSDEWKQGPREAILADIVNFTTVVVPIDAAAMQGLRKLRDDKPAAAAAQSAPTGMPPSTVNAVTFLYFKDIAKAGDFYGKTLGLRNTLNLTWVKIFETSPGASVGLVSADRGAHKPSAEKPVMISLVVPKAADVDAWHAFLKAKGVTMRSEPHDSGKGGPDDANVHAFGFVDPEGHTLEVFSWR